MSQRPLAGWLRGLLPAAVLLLLLLAPPPLSGLACRGLPLLQPALAAPVSWQELPATSEGRQWWDAGSLRADRNGTLSVLSRFQPLDPDEVASGAAAPTTAPPPATVPPGALRADAVQAVEATASAGGAARRAPATLYVMELDCGTELYRDISVNGLPRFRAEWRPAAADSLALATLRAACAAWEASHA